MTFEEFIESSFCTAILELRLSKEEFLDLTPYELSVLVQYHDKKRKNEYEMLRNVVINAHANLNREEGQDEYPLFDNGQEEQKDTETILKERKELFG